MPGRATSRRRGAQDGAADVALFAKDAGGAEAETAGRKQPRWTHAEPSEIRVSLHPEAAIGRPREEALADPLLDWKHASPVLDAKGIVIAIDVDRQPAGKR
jgi:hypothetical protein